LKQITPSTLLINDVGRWSPQGNDIIFAAKASADVRRSIWVVHANGSGLHQIPIAGCGGSRSDPNSIGCLQPAWSPDGQKIVFSRFSAATQQQDIYTVNADGTGLFQITHGGGVDGPDWGVHPLAS
jgi:Tol biopolymer transport system component